MQRKSASPANNDPAAPFLIEYRRFPLLPPKDEEWGRYNPAQPHSLGPLETPPTQWRRLPIHPFQIESSHSTLPYWDFPAYHLHPIVSVRIVYFLASSGFMSCGKKKDIISMGCRNSKAIRQMPETRNVLILTGSLSAFPRKIFYLPNLPQVAAGFAGHGLVSRVFPEDLTRASERPAFATAFVNYGASRATARQSSLRRGRDPPSLKLRRGSLR